MASDRHISLTEIIVEILLQWRMILIWMLLGGLLMGTLGYVQSSQTVATQNAAMQKQEDEKAVLTRLEKSLTLTQKSNVRAVLSYEDYADYYNNSLLMQIDAKNVPKTELTFYVKADSLDLSQSLERLYEDAITCGIVQWLTEKNPNKYDARVSELITVVRDTKELSIGTTNVITDTTQSNSFSIQVVHLTKEECVELADAVAEYFSILNKKMSKNTQAHDVILVSRSFAQVMDNELLNQQRIMTTNVATNNTNAMKLMESFSGDEELYYDLLKNFDNTEESTEGQTALVSALKPSVSVKYIMLGVVLFAFIYVFYVFMKYIMNNKLRAKDDIKEIYNLPQLGVIPQEASRKKFLGFVDRWILKLRNRNERSFTCEEAIGLATVSVKMAAKRENINELYCVGCSIKGRTLKYAEQIQRVLREDAFNLSILSNVLYNQDELEKLSSAECVFLLEKAGETLYDEIEKELELLRRQDIKVLGVVVIE